MIEKINNYGGRWMSMKDDWVDKCMEEWLMDEWEDKWVWKMTEWINVWKND